MNGRAWTEAELALLADMYPHCNTDDVAAWLQRRGGTVFAAANSRGIHKTPEYLAWVSSGRIQRGRRDARMLVTQFQPGLVPWNKGSSYVSGGRSAETRFRKGEKRGAAQHNYVPVGTLRVGFDGNLERKVTDDPNIYPARRWTPVARLVWEAAHGPIPRGHLVVFRPGTRTAVEAEITTERLECITRAENARRNHPRNKSPELAKLVQLKGVITRQVNRIVREHAERKTTP